MEDAFVAGSEEICAFFFFFFDKVPFVAFPVGAAIVQNLRHVLGDGLGKGDRRSSSSTKLYKTGKVEAD